jgi:hypothetical protein
MMPETDLAPEPAQPFMQTLWFESYQDAMSYRRNAGIEQAPQKRSVWIYPRHEEVWSLQIDW